MKLARFSLSAVFVVMVMQVLVTAGAGGCGDCGQACEAESECPPYFVVCSNGIDGDAQGCSSAGCCWEGAELCENLCDAYDADVVHCSPSDE
ncbi:uncharacterized protein SOCEGT47_055440 [Sorangium cellulosum]|uniref:Secreted protein n=1 Tax=Sorangium cellulosum TaxID=56 RepID=A0A4P2Q7L3_SORCE|nr:uncharacterized protein SOCEGT47_055440 [Sorangium cellulosum]